MGAREMVQGLRIYTVLSEDTSLVPAPTRQLTRPVILVPGTRIPSSGLHGHLHLHAHTLPQFTQTHAQLKNVLQIKLKV